MKCLESMTSTQPTIQNANFANCIRKLKKSHTTKKSILLNFLNLSTILFSKIVDMNSRFIRVLLWIKPVMKHSKWSKYFYRGYLKNFIFHFTSCSLYISIKNLKNAPKLWKKFRHWSLKQNWMSHLQKLVSTDFSQK